VINTLDINQLQSLFKVRKGLDVSRSLDGFKAKDEPQAMSD